MTLKKLKKELLRPIKRQQKHTQISIMSMDSVWFYSQMKSGTTYTIIFLINYLNEISKSELSKKDIFDILPYFHSVLNVINNNTPSQIREQQDKLIENIDFPYFLHTHKMIDDFSKKRILMSRNPLDYLISSYHYHYVNRGKKTPLTKAWKHILDEFIEQHKHQQSILEKQPNTTLYLQYEDVVTQPEQEFKRLVDFLALPYDEDLFQLAIQKSQKKEVQKIEKEGGSMIVALKEHKQESFIRSGKIGEWEDYLSGKLKDDVFNYLKNNHIKF